MKLGNEAILGVIESLEETAVSCDKIMEDGKVNFEDMPEAISYLTKLPDIIEKMKKAGDAWKQSKDIDKDEAVEIVSRIYDAFERVSGHKA